MSLAAWSKLSLGFCHWHRGAAFITDLAASALRGPSASSNIEAQSTQELHIHGYAGQTVEDMAIDMKDRTASINTNPASGKTHIALVHGGDHPKADWITMCKWRYGDIPHEAVSTQVTPRKKCKRCWSIYL